MLFIIKFVFATSFIILKCNHRYPNYTVCAEQLGTVFHSCAFSPPRFSRIIEASESR